MKKENKKKRFIILFILIFILYYLLKNKFYILSALYIIFTTLFLVAKNYKKVKNKFKFFCKKRRKINDLKYYYITDDNKVNDIEMRRKTYDLLRDMSKLAYVVLVFNICAMYYLLTVFFGNQDIFKILLILTLIIVLILRFSGSTILFIYKYTTTAYVLVPILCFLSLLTIIDVFNLNLPIFVYLGIYIGIVLISYLLFSSLCPVHILRKLNGRTVLISSFITIITIFTIQISSYYFTNLLIENNYLLTIERVESAANISETLKSIVIENPELIEAINYFMKKEMIAQLTSFINLATTGVSIAFIIGALFITQKLRRNNSKAKKIYRGIIRDSSLITYSLLIKCSFYGGEEYENLILNNTLMRQSVIYFERGITIPDITRKKRFLQWLESNSAAYHFIINLKNGLTKKEIN